MSDVITIDIMPVHKPEGKGGRRYEVIARHGGEAIANHYAREGYGSIHAILKKVEALGFSRDTGIDFYRGTTLVFLRRSLGDWLGDYERKTKKQDDEEDEE
jgi:hypothetical protein